MCTLSWWVGEGHYSVFFNRDESRERPRALAPAIFHHAGRSSIMPVDPQGGGSWLAVNTSGLTFALLNYYQGRLPKGRLQSRGQIVKALANCETMEEVQAWLAEQNLQKFAPFSLLVFSPELLKKKNIVPAVPLYLWDGKNFKFDCEGVRGPYFSSAVNYDEVTAIRLKVYDELINQKTKVSVEDFIAFHRSHLPKRSRYSICMHRDDAQTVSFSRVDVSQTEVQFFYCDGSPCEAPLQAPLSLHRR